MAISSGSGPGAPMSEINITPFVDVMMVLLIIFMITAPMISRGVELDLPQAKAEAMEVDESKLLMTIDAGFQVFLGETPIPHEQLEEALMNNVRLQREGELYLQADRRIPYGFVVQVMAVVKQAGIPKLGMVTDPLEGSWPPADLDVLRAAAADPPSADRELPRD